MKTAIYSTQLDNEAAATRFAAGKRAEGYDVYIAQCANGIWSVEYWDFFDAPVTDVPHGC